MSFTISYNIKMIDKYSRTGLLICEVTDKMNEKFEKLKSLSLKSARAMKKLSEASLLLGSTSESLNDKIGDTNRKLDKSTSETRQLTAETRKLNRAKKNLVRTNQRFAVSNGAVLTRMRTVGNFMDKAGGLAIKAAVPVLGLGLAAGKVAMDFETAMVEVQKVTSKAVSKEMAIRIRDMAKTIPVTQSALANMTADAARFGIRGTENIESFTRAVAKMAIATDLTTDEAGVAFAKIQQLTGISADKTENLGSAINSLSNNYATSSKEIVSAMLRSSAAASDFGLTGTQIAGLSAQINAVSESAERAGTRMRTLFIELQNPKKVKKYAKAIGMSTKQFEAMRKANPSAALFELVKALDEGGKASKRLRKIAGGEAIQALTAMSKNIDKTKLAMIESKYAFEQNISLNKEFKDASDTTANKLALLKNKFIELAIKAGPVLLPIANKIIDKLGSLASWFDTLNPKTVETALKIAFFALKAGILLKVLGKLNLGVVAITELFPLVGSSAAGAATGVSKVGKAMKALNVYVLAVAAGYVAVKAAWDVWENRGQKKVNERQKLEESGVGDRILKKSLKVQQLHDAIKRERALINKMPTSDLGASFESPDKLFQTFHSTFDLTGKVLRPIDELNKKKEESIERIRQFEAELGKKQPGYSDEKLKMLQNLPFIGSSIQKTADSSKNEVILKIDLNDPGNMVERVKPTATPTVSFDLGGNLA